MSHVPPPPAAVVSLAPEVGRTCHVFVAGGWHRGTITALIPARQGKTKHHPELVEVDWIPFKGERRSSKVTPDRVQVDLL